MKRSVLRAAGWCAFVPLGWLSVGCGMLLGFEEFEATSCEPGASLCSGRTLQICNETGDGVESASKDCATAGLCELAAQAGESICPDPACQADAMRCGGGETRLEGERCATDRTGYETQDLCDVADLQCNPATAECFELKMDVTEVTRGDYADFLASRVEVADQAVACEWNVDFEPEADCMAEPSVCAEDCDDHPQPCVDWCDAAAYCEWRGKRLCGALGTGALVDFDAGYADPGQSEWMNGCSAGGQYVFGHGDEAPKTTTQACTYAGRLDTTYPVGTRGDCHSPGRGYTRLFDLSGNLAEWTNNCETAATAASGGEDTACHTRGGSFASALSELECATVSAVAQRRKDALPTVGFRCCDD